MKEKRLTAFVRILLILCLLFSFLVSVAGSDEEEEPGNPWFGVLPFLLTGGFSDKELNPQINSIELLPGDTGDTLYIYGSDFSSSADNNLVVFSGSDNKPRVPAQVSVATNERLVVRVPEEASSGPLFVDVQGNWSNEVQFDRDQIWTIKTSPQSISNSNQAGDSGGIPWFGLLPWLLTGGSEPQNQPPIAEISASPTSGEAPLEVNFDGSNSSDPEGDDLSYEWDFGDDTAAEGEIVQHGFGTVGSYTVRLLVTDSKGKSDTASKTISVSQPPHETTEEQTFDTQEGIEYNTGTGLEVFVPPDPSGGQTILVVTENLTPQQPWEGEIELQSVYDVSLVSTFEIGSQAGGMTPKSSSENNLKVRLTFEIPPGVDPGNVMILQWTEEGWGLASSGESSTTTPTVGGVVNPDGRTISIEGPSSCLASTSIGPQGLGSWWESTRVALCNFTDYIINKFDCSPIYPDILAEACEDKGTYIEQKVLLRSPRRGFGGIWFKVEVEGSDNLVETPQWDPPSHCELERWLSDHDEWYLSPTEDKAGTLTLRFPPQGGKVRISLDAGEALGAQISGWIISMVPFGDLSESVIEEIWTVVDNAIRGRGSSHSTRWSEVAVKTRELVSQIVNVLLPKLAKELGGEGAEKIVKELLSPLNLATIIANEITYNWTIASSQAGYCEQGYCTWDVSCTGNRAPVADAGTDREVTVGALVTLNGSQSSDPDPGDSLTYHWEQTDGPEVSLATDPNDPKATFTPTEPGPCRFKLVVNDGKEDSAPAYVAVTVGGVLILGTWNVRGYPETSSERRIWFSDELSALDLDILCVQEIANQDRVSSFLSTEEGFNTVAFKDSSDGMDNAIFFADGLEMIDISDPEGFHHPAQAVYFCYQGLDATLITVHLAWTDQEQRAKERDLLVDVVRQALEVDPDVIIAGDFNTTEKTGDTISGLANSLGLEVLMPNNAAIGTTYAGNTYDYILVSPDLYAEEAIGSSIVTFEDENIASAVSDHRPVRASFWTDQGYGDWSTWPPEFLGSFRWENANQQHEVSSEVSNETSTPSQNDQTVTSTIGELHIVINEFDLNPLCDDRYKTCKEWVELYNPTDDAVSLWGWTLKTTHGNTVIVNISDLCPSIGSHSYCLIEHPRWLDNNSESIILRDAAGTEVDRTPTKSDSYNDGRSWQRDPNGYDTDSATDWTLTTSTKGKSN